MLIPSVYDVQAIDFSTSAVFTNTAPTSVYRGAGRPEAIYLIERLVERAAQVTGIDRVELRRRNLIQPDAMPYHTPTHHNYDSGEFEQLMDECLELADWNGFDARRKESERNGKLRGRAVTPYIELAGVFNERMELRFDPSGMVTIIAGTHSHGQGHATAFAQLVADWLGVPFEAINFVQGDTDEGAYRSRHLRCAQLHGRRQRAYASPPTPSSREARKWRRADGGGGRRHRIQGRHVHGDGHG